MGQNQTIDCKSCKDEFIPKSKHPVCKLCKNITCPSCLKKEAIKNPLTGKSEYKKICPYC